MSTHICQNLPASDPSAKAVLMPPTVYENLRMIANAVNNMVAGGAIQITKGQEGIAISYLPSPEKYLATITGNATTSGMYTVVGLNGALNGNITGNTAGNWTAGCTSGGGVVESDLGNQTGYGLLLNFGESGNCGNSLPAGLPVWGWLLGYSTDGKQTPIVAANVAPPGLIPVTLTQTGGNFAGNGTSAANWTYTIGANWITGRTITAPGNQTPAKSVWRCPGFALTPATLGTAAMKNGNYTIFEAFETPFTQMACGDSSGNCT